jgi:hypothetical protein
MVQERHRLIDPEVDESLSCYRGCYNQMFIRKRGAFLAWRRLNSMCLKPEWTVAAARAMEKRKCEAIGRLPYG